MANKKIVLLISNLQEFIYHTGAEEKKFAAEMNRLYESISYVYIPLLNMFASLEKDGVPFKIALVLSPVLCTLLKDPVVQRQYIAWLDAKIELGKSELKRCEDDAAMCDVIKFHLEKVQEDRFCFTAVYGQDLLKKIAEYQKKGCVELLATCGTNIFLPHYADMGEVLNAQIETGLYAHRSFFGERAKGFWLPEAGYVPGLERVMRTYGVDYTVLDARSFLFSDDIVEKGIFAPVVCGGEIVAFARDNRTDEEVFGEKGYASSSVYCNVNRDIAFELSFEQLAPYFRGASSRYASGYQYYNKGAEKKGSDRLYDPVRASEQSETDAAAFFDKKLDVLVQAEALLPSVSQLSLVCTFSVEQFLQQWHEGVSWLENIYRYAKDKPASFSSFEDIIAAQGPLQNLQPYCSASIGSGYGETLIANKNNWMLRHARKASERMVDLAERFPDDTGLKARLLNLSARELLLAQSCTWANMIWEGTFPEYAEARFTESIGAFIKVFESLGANTVSTEWLTSYEAKHPVFPWINYRIFSKKR